MASFSHFLAGVASYRFLEELGSGASARVFLVEDSRDGRQAVLKLLTEASTPQLHKRFTREIKALSAFDHPAIVRILDSGVHEGRPWYVMERLDRQPLDRVLHERFHVRNSIAQPGETRQALTDVASALAYAHSRQVVHRDLKPSNVLVDEAFRATLIDFGVARILDHAVTKLTETGTFLGTPAYAAPEQLEKGQADFRSDVYSFGLLAYELLTGKLPHADLPPVEMIRQRTHEPIAPPSTLNPTIPPGLERVVLRCVLLEPEQRYQSMEVLSAELADAFAGGRPAALPAPTARPRQDRPAASPVAPAPAGRSRWPGLALGLGLALIAGLTFLVLRPPGQASTPIAESAAGQSSQPSPGRVDDLRVDPGSTSVRIRFRTAGPLGSWVTLTGPGAGRERTELSRLPATEHEGELPDLSPDTEYRYQLHLEDAGGRRWDAPAQIFRTRASR